MKKSSIFIFGVKLGAGMFTGMILAASALAFIFDKSISVRLKKDTTSEEPDA